VVCGCDKDFPSCALYCNCSDEDSCYNPCTNTEDGCTEDEEGVKMVNADEEIVEDERTKV